MPRPRLSREALDRLREKYPHFDADHQLAEAVVRDCAIAYVWNPYVDADAFAYTGWSTTLYAAVDEASRTAYVVFRGTDSLLDWVVNLSCVPVPFFHPWAHAALSCPGSWHDAGSCRGVRAHEHRFDRVVISGHSLGGALAMACAYELHRERFAIDRCVTIGAPPIYTALSAATVEDAIGTRVMRISRTQDIVPRVPPPWLGYRHVGQEWTYVSELFGDREPTPLPEVERWLGAGLRILTLGPCRGLARAQRRHQRSGDDAVHPAHGGDRHTQLHAGRVHSVVSTAAARCGTTVRFGHCRLRRWHGASLGTVRRHSRHPDARRRMAGPSPSRARHGPAAERRGERTRIGRPHPGDRRRNR